LFADGFDDAIIGVNNEKIVYSKTSLIMVLFFKPYFLLI
jgi:hypothetical protein